MALQGLRRFLDVCGCDFARAPPGGSPWKERVLFLGQAGGVADTASEARKPLCTPTVSLVSFYFLCIKNHREFR